MNADTDFIDFAMFDTPARPGPCRKAAAEETDPVAARLERERIWAEWLAHGKNSVRVVMEADRKPMSIECVEVKYGSGKVKV